jgi:hypothetical protein
MTPDTLKATIAAKAAMAMAAVIQSRMVFFPMLHTAEIKRTATTTLIPRRAFCTQRISAKLFRNIARSVMMMTEGVTTPAVVTQPPRDPLRLYPTKVATFTATMPGVACPIAK